MTYDNDMARARAAGDGMLDESVSVLPGIGEKRAAHLENMGIASVRDLLFHFPREHQDRRRLSTIAEAVEGSVLTVEAEIVSARSVSMRGRMSATEALLRDDSGEIRAIWFGMGFLARSFKPGTRGVFTGTVGKWRGLAFRHPEYELLDGTDEDRLHSGRVVPVYRLTEKVTQRMLRRWIRTALDHAASNVAGRLPGHIRATHGFPHADSAIVKAHFPDEPEEARRARDMFAYEELLGIQLGILGARAMRLDKETGNRHSIDGPMLSRLRGSLPFELTLAQECAITDILTDMQSPRPMLRLLQGDVGCGKTVVALHAIAAAADGGFQTAVMAPTEILAEQHALSLADMLRPLGLDVCVLTGSTREATAVRGRVARGEVAVVVGTHALIQDKTEFNNLGLAIIDEQHRFGVAQRGRLAEKGINTDILHMTATPIPRTLAITVYGGMDISVIDELPPGRSPVMTKRVPESKTTDLYRHIVEQAEKGFQAYVVCPLVEESDTRDLTAVTTHFEDMAATHFRGIRVGLIHGRMSIDEKDAVMHRFRRGEIDVLFSTTVIEVGIDCPNATTMVIEDAAQFGLTQLHQLRGRVGRGSERSHCFLLGKHKTPEGRQRLETMCATTSGFDIAEADLNMRGPGEFRGIRQAGLSDLRVADLIRDVRLLDCARRDAQRILEQDPTLALPEHAHLARLAREFRELDA